MTKEIIAIWAEDEDGVIGQNATLPWHLPRELQHFKKTTWQQAILMGRVTFDGMNQRLLPNRQTLVLTRDLTYDYPGVIVVNSVEKALEWYHAQEKTLYILGGRKVLEAFAGYYDKLIRTRVHGHFSGDTYAPTFDYSHYQEQDALFYEKDEKNSHDFTVSVFVKK
ncbi:dihydrofolate reductase [Streptococcus halichoeri]|uniref:dihydrofolate reductase n=1 Tax=Streptococcus halichoeri TaxID=254785 RepID=UPI001C8DAA6B|nr:dihydrofolate reductase [Streptococcus halichoeri]